MQALSQPQRIPHQPLPAIATEISGKTYTLEDNPFGWHTMTFTFQDDVDEATVTIDGTQQITIGMDNVYRTYTFEDSMFPQEFRGRWESMDTFLVEDIVLGQTVKVISRIQFSGDVIHINWKETYSGSGVEIQGAQNPVTK
jgi:hypothetical protein